MGLAALFALAFVNGANDVGKSVAPLVGSAGLSVSGGVRRALFWGAAFAGVGSACAIFLSGRLFLVFTQDLVVRTPTATFALAALAGAAVWVLIATLFRLPVSTTHAIVGAIVFQAVYLYGISNVEWGALGLRVLLPLSVSPFAALVVTYLLGRLSSRRRATSESPRRGGVFHWLSAAATAFARGINDAPKMASLGSFFLLGALQGAVWLPYIVVAVAVVLGSLVWGHRVTKTLTGRVARLDDDSRLRAGFTTAALVSVGTLFGAPVSTTHVSAGAATGTRAEEKEVLWTAARVEVLPWFVTFPVAGILAIAVLFLGVYL